MKWTKLGRVWGPSGEWTWARTHALLPTPFVVGDCIRVYFAALDADKVGRVGFVDVDTSEPQRVIRVSAAPVLDRGPLGTFDDCGVTPSSVLAVGSEIWMYYVGWQRSFQVPYALFTGLARSTDGGLSFSRHQDVPVIDRIAEEPFSRGAPFVQRDHDGRFAAWYWSSVGWTRGDRGLHYNNDVRAIASEDGIRWNGAGRVSIRRRSADGEYSLGRPWVLRTESASLMWYTIRSHSNPDAAGLARSFDGQSWSRVDSEQLLHRSKTGWDSEMLCYPAVVRVANRLVAFYNGNRHGEAGFGVAIHDLTANPG